MARTQTPVQQGVPPTIRVATLGAAISANKGAASMIQALVDNLPAFLGPCRFDVLTTYPAEDRRENLEPAVSVVSARPIEFLLMFPLALLSWVGAAVGIPRRVFCLLPAMKALLNAHVVVDVAGISFADGRGMPILGYNFLMTTTPLLLGKRTVKAAQALGPFKALPNRTLARLVLPRLCAIGARGPETRGFLEGLGLTNVTEVADLAFTMNVKPEDTRWASDKLGERARNAVGIAPSAVVDRYCRRLGCDYAAVIASFIDNLTREFGLEVVVFPHSARPGHPEGRMNDIPLCRRIASKVANRHRCTLIDDSLSPGRLRALIDHFPLLVTSRFHAMISALAVETPVVVVSWSHKYREVLSDFGLEDHTVDFSHLSADALTAQFAQAHRSRSEISGRIRENLPAVIDRAMLNHELVTAAVETRV